MDDCKTPGKKQSTLIRTSSTVLREVSSHQHIGTHKKQGTHQRRHSTRELSSAYESPSRLRAFSKPYNNEATNHTRITRVVELRRWVLVAGATQTTSLRPRLALNPLLYTSPRLKEAEKLDTCNTLKHLLKQYMSRCE